MKKIGFFKEGIKNLKTIGAVTRSSKHLCRELIKPIDFEHHLNIVELGAGDGVITKHIVNNLHPDANLMVFEVLEKFIPKIELIDDPRMSVIQDTAERLPHYLDEASIEKVDVVLSAIPFVMLSEEKAREIVKICYDVLKKDGLFIQLHYSLALKKMYKSIFGNLEVHFVARNVPPAFRLLCTK